MTIQDLIDSTLVSIGFISPVQTPTSTQRDRALVRANELLRSWNREKLLPPSKSINSVTLTPNRQNYNIATGQVSPHFNIARPDHVEDASTLYGLVEQGLHVIHDVEEWKRISLKSTSATNPNTVYYDAAVPTGVLYFYPVPTTACTVILYLLSRYTTFATLATVINMADGADRAFRFALRPELASEFNMMSNITALDLEMMNEAIGVLKSSNAILRNAEADYAASDSISGGDYNILSDNPGGHATTVP